MEKEEDLIIVFSSFHDAMTICHMDLLAPLQAADVLTTCHFTQPHDDVEEIICLKRAFAKEKNRAQETKLFCFAVRLPDIRTTFA